jgi:AraC-like DNA-binding protein
MLKYNDYGFTSGPTINLAEIYLIQNNLSESKQYIDSARKYNALMPRYGILPRIYEVLSKYYTETGNKKLSIAYMDSALQANKEHEEEFNAMLLLRMEQKESARRQQELIREKEIRRDVQIRLLMISGGFVVISILSVLLFVFYRRKRRAYLGLYHQIKEQDRLAEELNAMTKQYEQMEQSMPKSAEDDGDEDGDEDDVETLRAVQTLCATSLPGNRQQRELVSRLREFLLKDNYFATFDIDIQELIPEMATNRAYFFKALKTVTGKTPMEFINDLRLDEAKRLLDNTNLTIETIAFECGFNTVRTFYRQFRDRYSITPAEYRNMAEVVSG